MKRLEFQKVLKEGIIITEEFVIVRRDIYDKQIELLNRRMQGHIFGRPN